MYRGSANQLAARHGAAASRTLLSTSTSCRRHIDYRPSLALASGFKSGLSSKKQPSKRRDKEDDDNDGEDAAPLDFDRLLQDDSVMGELQGKLLSGMAQQHSRSTSDDGTSSGPSRAGRGPSRESGGRGGAGRGGGRMSSDRTGGREYAGDRRPAGRGDGRTSSDRPRDREYAGDRRPEGRSFDGPAPGRGRGGGRGSGRSEGGRGRGAGPARGGRGFSAPAFNWDGFRFPNENGPVAVLKAGKEWLFANGSPMVYSGAIEVVLAPGGGRPANGLQAGDPLLVADFTGKVIAWGVFNPVSMFRIRIMQLAEEYESDRRRCFMDMATIIRLRVRQARKLRKRLHLPRPGTDVYRLINSEGDRLSGLVADVLGPLVVVQSVAAWAERYRPEVEAAVAEETGIKQIIWRVNSEILKEEGIIPEGASAAEAKGQGHDEEEGEEQGSDDADVAEGDEGIIGGDAEEEEQAGSSGSEGEGSTFLVEEAGVKYYTSPLGQKTGYYADQRDSRAFMAQMCKGARVLDLCCYSGGFALSAALAGAESVTGVDSSPAAIRLAEANAKLNGVQDVATFIRSDISVFMKAQRKEREQYDVVVLDPPKLAPTRASLNRATIKYEVLNKQALMLVKPGGLLMTCSCSGAMTQSGQMPQVVAAAARAVGRQVTLLRLAGPSPDHPMNPAYPEGNYLTNLTYAVM